jgi:molecular chaperone DnaK (HSP70)
MDIEEPWARQESYAKAEALKKQLSSLDKATTSITGSGRPLTFEMTRADFEKLIKAKVTKTEADGGRIEPDPGLPEDARGHFRRAACVHPQP